MVDTRPVPTVLAAGIAVFDPTVVEIGSDSPKPREADGGGVGLHLIRSYADQIQYTALGGRNRIVFRCGVDQAPEGTER